MRGRVLSNLRPTPATAVALIALLFAMTGNVGAAPRTLANLAGGPVQTPTYTDDDQVGNIEVNIPLNGSAKYTFVQKAGEAVLITALATLTLSPTTNFCGATLRVRGIAGETPNGPASWVGLTMTAHSNKGDYGELSDSEALPAPGADRGIELEAVVVEGQRNDPGLATLYGPGDTCDGFGPNAQDPNDPDYDPGQDEWTASVRVSIVTFRN